MINNNNAYRNPNSVQRIASATPSIYGDTNTSWTDTSAMNNKAVIICYLDGGVE